MLKNVSRQLRAGIIMLLFLTVLTGLVYPGLISGLAGFLFPFQAEGSILYNDQGKALGSALIGQNFSDPGLFWARPSATKPIAYNAAASGASNLSPTNPELAKAVANRLDALRTAHGGYAAVPVEMLAASASGLDPHISPLAALYQLPRIAKATGLSEESLRLLVADHTEEPQLGLLGEYRVNVLLLNLALAEMLNN